MTTKQGGIVAALARAQATMENAPMNKTNPHFKSRYADLASIRDTVVPALAAEGIAVVQAIDVRGYGPAVVTKLLMGEEEITSECPVVVGETYKPQEFGSALTYARRYSLAAIVGIAAEEDDDGNAAQGGAQNGVAKPRTVDTEPDDPLSALKKEAARIKKAINGCDYAAQVNDIWEKNADVLKQISDASTTAYEALSDAKDVKLDSFHDEGKPDAE